MDFLNGRMSGLTGPEEKLGPLMRLFRANFRPYAGRYAMAMGMLLVSSAATGASAYIMKDIINRIFIERNDGLVVLIASAILVIYLVKGLSSYFATLILTRIGNSIVARLQRQLYAAVIRQDVSFFQRLSLGDVVVRISQNAQAARSAIDLIVLSLGRDLFSLIALVSVMVFQNPLMSLMALFTAPVAIFAITNLLKKVRTAARREVGSLGQIVTIVQESVQGIRVVKSFGLEVRLQAAFDGATVAVEKLSNRIAALGARSSPLMETLGGFAIAFVVLFGGYQVIHYNADAGAFFSFITALILAYEPAKRLARFNLDLEKSLVGVRMMFEVVDMVPAMASAPDAIEADFTSATVALDGVHFAYGETPVLSNVSLVAPAGSVVALVGPSGAGKSTLFALIERFYDPSAGAVTINGIDIRRFSLASLRRQIALVTQDTFLFDGTVAANIADGRPGANLDEIIEAARDANAYDFIMAMPDGFDSRVGEGGGNLSGGQRQRIAIARAILRQAPILLLDEATSALDAQAEKDIQAALARLMQGRTTFVIAHRLATVRDADQIVVMDRGEVKQRGNHDALIAEGGLYAHLHALQFRDGGEST